MMNKKRVIKFLEASDIRLMIDHLPDNLRGRRDKAVFEVLFSTGLRISELLALRRQDFTASDPSKTLQLTIVGKGQVQRCVYVSPTALKAVLRYFAGRTDDEDRVFCISKRGLQKLIKVRAIEAGMEKPLSVHTMRHSFACHVLKNGTSIYYVQQFLGHKNLATTAVYLHATNKELKDIHEKLMK